jgi:hypothetical protein
MLALGSTAALVAGCGSSPSHPAGANSSLAAQAFAYARCIRAHGFPAFPDPHVSASPGSTKVAQEVPPSAGLSPKFPAAQQACRAIMPGPQNRGSNDQGPRKQTLLAFAHCLRSHGVHDFPDPTGQGQLTLQMVSAAGVDVHAPSFFAAAKACVGVTHGEITLADVARAINGPH